MSDVLICPDCGGVIGATEATEHGQPCRCFEGSRGAVALQSARKSHAAEESAREDESVSSSNDDMPSEPMVQDPPSSPKICVRCGKDVTGQKRLKDSRGYTCYECAKEQRRMERGDRIKCQACGRERSVQGIVEYEGMKICDHCHRERVEAAKKSIKKYGIKQAHVRYEKKRVYTLLGIAAFLLIIILLRTFHIIGPKE